MGEDAVAEAAQQSEAERLEGERSEAEQADIEAKAAPRAEAANPHMRPLESKPVRRIHHGQTGAMWTASLLSLVGFVVGGIAVLIGPNWVLFAIAVVICIVALGAGAVMQKLGYGIYERQ